MRASLSHEFSSLILSGVLVIDLQPITEQMGRLIDDAEDEEEEPSQEPSTPSASAKKHNKEKAGKVPSVTSTDGNGHSTGSAAAGATTGGPTDAAHQAGGGAASRGGAVSLQDALASAVSKVVESGEQHVAYHQLAVRASSWVQRLPTGDLARVCHVAAREVCLVGGNVLSRVHLVCHVGWRVPLLPPVLEAMTIPL